jgi:hypothetical protein
MRVARAVALAVVLAGLVPGIASAAALHHVSMFSDHDEYVGAGGQRFYTPATGQIAVRGTPGDLTVSVSGGTFGDAFTLEFAAPRGEQLRPGVYGDAQRAPVRDAGRPGLDVNGWGRSCFGVNGRFEVKDLALSGGVVQRLWIVYEHHCERHVAASFGEVRLGEPGPAGRVGVAPSIVRWPLGDLDHAGEPVPVHVRVADAATLGSVSIGGADHDDFEIGVDECSGHSLPKGSQCAVWVRFTPTKTGTRLATLRIPEGGRVHEVALQAFAHGGRTRVHMVSDPGDPIGEGSTWDYNPGTALLETWTRIPASRSLSRASTATGGTRISWPGRARSWPRARPTR